MINIIILLFLITIIFVYLYKKEKRKNDNFMVYASGNVIFPLDTIDKYNYPKWGMLPFDNMRQGQTTNMSYDLRGDPLTIPKYPFMWNYSTLTPIHNKQLC
jgi:hypothetical protein